MGRDELLLNDVFKSSKLTTLRHLLRLEKQTHILLQKNISIKRMKASRESRENMKHALATNKW